MVQAQIQEHLIILLKQLLEESKAIRGDFTASEDDNVLVKGVSGDKGGIAYFGLAYYEENKRSLIKAVAIKNSTGEFVIARP